MSSGYHRAGAHVRPWHDANDDKEVKATVTIQGPPVDVELEKFRVPPPSAMGFTGDECDHCHGSRVVQTGHCKTCQDCGTTSGCS